MSARNLNLQHGPHRTGTDRAMLYGAFLWMADKLRSEDGAHAAALWQRRGKRAFEAGALQHTDPSAIGTP